MQSIRTDLKKALCLKVLKTLCRIFWGPDIWLCQDVINGEFTELLKDASDSFKTDMAAAISESVRLSVQYKDAESLFRALSDGYIALFINDINGTSAPLYHSCYLAADGRLMGPPAMDMRRRIERSGLSISLPGNEPPDHLAIELEYLFYLMDQGWSEPVGNHLPSAVLFASDVMAEWVGLFYERIAADGRFPFYTIAAQLLCLIIGIVASTPFCFSSSKKPLTTGFSQYK